MTRADLITAIERQRDVLLDCDLDVDAKREALRLAEAERDRAAVHLAQLIALGLER